MRGFGDLRVVLICMFALLWVWCARWFLGLEFVLPRLLVLRDCFRVLFIWWGFLLVLLILLFTLLFGSCA